MGNCKVVAAIAIAVIVSGGCGGSAGAQSHVHKACELSRKLDFNGAASEAAKAAVADSQWQTFATAEAHLRDVLASPSVSSVSAFGQQDPAETTAIAQACGTSSATTQP
jgi:hypothetical protein